MKTSTLIGVLATLAAISGSHGQVTTIFVGINYCPPPTTAPSPLPATGPFVPYFLSVPAGSNENMQYLNGDGHLVGPASAATFIMTDDGRLQVGKDYISTEHGVKTQSFGTSAQIGSISKLFSLSDGQLRWAYNTFSGGQASFYKINNTIVAVFDGSAPNGGQLVQLGLVRVSSFFDQTASSSTNTMPTGSPTDTEPVTRTTVVSSASAHSASIFTSSFPSTSTLTTSPSSTISAFGTTPTITNDSLAGPATTDGGATGTSDTDVTEASASGTNTTPETYSAVTTSTADAITTRPLVSVNANTPTNSPNTGPATTTSSFTSGTCSPLPLASPICPGQNRTEISLGGDSTCYGVLCSTALLGTVNIANSTTANSLRACAAYCSVYNTAVPYGCMGVTFLGIGAANGQSNCLLYNETTEEQSAATGVDSLRLIYTGYPTAQKRALMVKHIRMYQ